MIEDLPSQLFSLHNLEKLNLFGNRLSGILSSEFSKLKKVLQICSLRNNMMYKSDKKQLNWDEFNIIHHMCA